MSWEGRNVQVKVEDFLRGFWLEATVAKTEINANRGKGGTKRRTWGRLEWGGGFERGRVE